MASELMECLLREQAERRMLWASTASAAMAAGGFPCDRGNCQCVFCRRIAHLKRLEETTCEPEYLNEIRMALDRANAVSWRAFEEQRSVIDIGKRWNLAVPSESHGILYQALAKHAEAIVRDIECLSRECAAHRSRREYL